MAPKHDALVLHLMDKEIMKVIIESNVYHHEVKIHDIYTEVPLVTNGYTQGFIDLKVVVTKKDNPYYEYVYIEVKPTLEVGEFGELIRQVNKYRSHISERESGKWCVYVERIEPSLIEPIKSQDIVLIRHRDKSILKFKCASCGLPVDLEEGWVEWAYDKEGKPVKHSLRVVHHNRSLQAYNCQYNDDLLYFRNGVSISDTELKNAKYIDDEFKDEFKALYNILEEA